VTSRGYSQQTQETSPPPTHTLSLSPSHNLTTRVHTNPELTRPTMKLLFKHWKTRAGPSPPAPRPSATTTTFQAEESSARRRPMPHDRAPSRRERDPQMLVHEADERGLACPSPLCSDTSEDLFPSRSMPGGGPTSMCACKGHTDGGTRSRMLARC
jgi:hypothetical protein